MMMTSLRPLKLSLLCYGTTASKPILAAPFTNRSSPFRIVSPKTPIRIAASYTISATPVSTSSAAANSASFGVGLPCFGDRRRGFRGGVVVKMAAQPGPVQKSEEEWRAILSPEQFRILRMKGTEYVTRFLFFLSFVKTEA